MIDEDFAKLVGRQDNSAEKQTCLYQNEIVLGIQAVGS